MTTTQSKSSAIKGILGVKLGMTQVFDENNRSIPVTVVEAGPCVVTQVRTMEKDGYEAVQFAFGAIDPRKVTKPESGQFAKAGVTPRRYVGELRTSNASSYTVGQEVKADVFAAGEIVDAQGTSIGKGTAGVMKRHNFRGFGDGHGVERKHRTSGSIGNRTTPGRVFKGKRMSGRMGIDTVTMQNLTIHSVDAEKNLILVKGSIPGINGSRVFIRSAAKQAKSEVLKKAGA
ncbi:MAG: 50S ribosomal protein L3 [Actinobacteria bacterium]|jgi:large subunit ribosomal protein L3|nr:50S ribosomal protein L3 [Actinomycetota bacterium]NCZ73065.1 50S ribosomal protein L3 [Actinomycetota bacterium]NDA41116.1 50S ribosomal protein L3 [Actinomycetota bacterium]NDB30968.1 50S ribosomal protein L3 [Actinomycetota bacterium]NDC52062.1 50S ribosomal protein L3 [Actinomycetota bacterium]